MNHTAQPGTVSHATLRTEDLIESFADCLESLILLNGDYLSQPANFQVRDILNNLVGESRDLLNEDNEIAEEDIELAQSYLDSLFEALDSFAPDGHYFGAHPGDASDFGFWAIEDESL